MLCPTLEATSTRAPDWVLLALLRWRSKSSIPGYGRLSFQAASTWLDQASTQNQTTRTVLMISWKKQNHIDQVDLQSFHEGLPQYDEDGFMAELQALPDQDELEESKVPGTW